MVAFGRIGKFFWSGLNPSVAASNFKSHREIVLAAVRQDGTNREYAATKADREIVLQAKRSPQTAGVFHSQPIVSEKI
eukprot:5814826-Amphidinium_carterae.1